MTAYYLLLSLFPIAIVVGQILPLFHITPESVLPYINLMLPENVPQVLDPIITELLTSTSGGILSLSAVGLIWSAGRGVTFLQRGMNKAYGVETKGGYLIKRTISLIMVVGMILVLIAFIFVFSIGQIALTNLAEFLPAAGVINQYLKDFKWPTIIAFLFVLLMAVYSIIPDVKLKIRAVWPGALLATGGIMALTQLFTVYMQFSSRSFSSYGTLATFFILLIWLQFSCVILLIGAVLNSTLFERKYGMPERKTSQIDELIEKHVIEKAQQKYQNFKTSQNVKNQEPDE